jgi:hypothetical protein
LLANDQNKKLKRKRKSIDSENYIEIQPREIHIHISRIFPNIRYQKNIRSSYLSPTGFNRLIDWATLTANFVV